MDVIALLKEFGSLGLVAVLVIFLMQRVMKRLDDIKTSIDRLSKDN